MTPETYNAALNKSGVESDDKKMSRRGEVIRLLG